MLSSFFSSVFTKEPQGSIPDIPLKSKNIITELQVTEDVTKKLKDLNPSKSCGPDAMHPRLLKELAEAVCVPLTVIFNKSLSLGKLPSVWKEANILAIYKKGNRKQPGSYRPVSLTCIPCKVLESFVRAEIISHMKQEMLFSQRQFGFISGRSTMLQLLVLSRFDGRSICHRFRGPAIANRFP